MLTQNRLRKYTRFLCFLHWLHYVGKTLTWDMPRNWRNIFFVFSNLSLAIKIGNRLATIEWLSSEALKRSKANCPHHRQPPAHAPHTQSRPIIRINLPPPKLINIPPRPLPAAGSRTNNQRQKMFSTPPRMHLKRVRPPPPPRHLPPPLSLIRRTRRVGNMPTPLIVPGNEFAALRLGCAEDAQVVEGCETAADYCDVFGAERGEGLAHEEVLGGVFGF